MGSGIYLVGADDGLIEMTEHTPPTEDQLQALLAEYPDLLAGQLNTANPRRWLLVAREVAVPNEVGSAGRMAVDHVFIDQDAVPTLVEVKRSSDTRIRREVVGQLLDYAANAVLHWDVDVLRSEFARSCESSPDEILREFTGGGDPDSFWEKARKNIDEGRIRLVFAADEIPIELQRIVEFLNEQMRPAEVLAVEVKQYAGGNQRTFVPRVIGLTAEADRRKSNGSRPSRQWDEPSFFEALAARQGADETRVARALLDWARGHGAEIWWGHGIRSASFTPAIIRGQTQYPLLAVYSYGNVEVVFQWLKLRPAFSDEGKRFELLRRLNDATGLKWGADAITRRPSVPLRTLTSPTALTAFLSVLDWAALEIMRS